MRKIIVFLLGLTLTATCFTSYMPAHATDASTDTASLEGLQTLENESNQKYNTLLLAWAYDTEYVDDATTSAHSRTNLAREVENSLSELSDFDNIKIITGVGHITPAATVQPGSIISNRSVGFWAKDSSGNIGIVTAPHDSISKGDTIKINGTTFGTASTPYWGDTVDAVFIKRTNSSFTVSRAVTGANFSLVDDSCIMLSVGSSTYSSGKSSGYKTGSVLDNNYSDTFSSTSGSSVKLKSCVVTSAPCQGGDSGGVVAGGGGTISGRYVAGIIAAHTASGEQVYTKMVNIKSKLGVTVY